MVRKSLIVGTVIVMGMTGSMLYGVTNGAEKSKNISAGADEGTTCTTYEVSQSKLVLDGKGEDYVLVCQRRFEVTSNTVIKDERGIDITLEGVLVPCEAMVTYYKKPRERNTYVAVSIEVKGKPTPQPE